MAGGILQAQIIQRVPGPVSSREEMRRAVASGRAPSIAYAGAIDQLRRMQGPVSANAPADAAAALANDQMARAVAASAAQALAQGTPPIRSAGTVPWYMTVQAKHAAYIGVGALLAAGAVYLVMRK